MTQPFSYYGGKQKLVSKIVPLIPKHTVFVEPFCGGASVFWHKKNPKVTNSNHYREVLNDMDGDIYNFFKQMRDNFEELNHLILYSNYSEQLYKEAITLKPKDDIEKAFYFYVNLNQSFGNKKSAGWGRGLFGRNSGVTYDSKRDLFNKFKERLKGVNLSHTDALKCIKDWDSPQSFFYIDSPYVNTHCGHYKGYTVADYKKLLKLLKIIKGSFILSSYDNPYLKDFPFDRFEIKTKMSADGKGRVDANKFKQASGKKELGDRNRTEVLIRKINRVVRPEIQKLYDSGNYDCYV